MTSQLSLRTDFILPLTVAILGLVGRTADCATTVTCQVSNGYNNAWGRPYNPTNEDPSYLRFGNWFTINIAGMRFHHCSVPKGTYVVDARLKIQAYDLRSDTVYAVVQAEDVDDPYSFIYKREFDRPTTAAVIWDQTSAWELDTWYTSPNIASVIQEVIDRPGWQSGFGICILYACRQTSGGYRHILAYKTNPSLAPKLEITYDQRVIAGRIADGQGAAIPDVTVSADNGGRTARTNSQGNYQVKIPVGWSGTVTVSKTGWLFTAPSRSYTDVTTSQSNQDYAGFQPSISGRILDNYGDPLENVAVTADNGGGSTATDENGLYEIDVPYDWSGTLTPTRAELFFEPESLPFTNVTTDQVDQDLTGFAFPKVSGYVTCGAAGVAEVLITADNNGVSAETDDQGYYQLLLPYEWSGTVSPAKEGWSFEPPSWSYSDLTTHQMNEDYVGLAPPTISGHVCTVSGVPAPGITVQTDGGVSSDTTDANGFYELTVPQQWSGAVTPNCPNRSFDPCDYSYAGLTVDTSEQNFTLLPIRVTADGSGDFPNIQAAIDAAFQGDQVIVEPGRYTGPGNYGLDFGGKAIAVRSINPEDRAIVHLTVIDPDRAGCGFYFHSGEGADSVVDGLTITAGRSAVGAGIWCRRSSPAIRNCVIKDCFAISHGGGIGLEDSSATVTDCLIRGNSTTEMGGGVACVWGGEPSITNCVITGNSLGGSGGGIAASACIVTVNNCTISGNKAQGPHGGTGGAISLWWDATAVVSNSILWNNDASEGPEIAVFGDIGARSALSVYYSDVQGGQAAVYVDPGCTLYWDVNNIDVDPCFAEPGYWHPNSTSDDANDDFWVSGDYHLKSEAGRWYPLSICARLDPAGDGFVSLADFAIFAGFWHQEGQSIPADLDYSSFVDLGDLRLLLDCYLGNYGTGVWVLDPVTSHCIDDGDPDSNWTAELWPHGKRVNMGTYGGTPEASMSLSGIGNIADLNNDDIVNLPDYAYVASRWEVNEVLLREDLDRNGRVDGNDVSIFADQWLWQGP